MTELSEIFFEEFNKKITPNTLGKHCNEIGLKKSTRSVKNHKFSIEEDDFIAKNKNLSNDELLIAFNDKFGFHISYSQIVGRKRKLDICKKIGFSKEEDLWLKDNYGKYPISEVREMFCLKFRKISNATLSNRALFLGLREKRHHYTKQENEWLIENISLYTYPELTKLFNQIFRTKVTQVSISRQCMQYLKIHRGENSFSASALPIGSEVKKNGIVHVKISDKPFERKDRWKSKNRIVYEREKGEIPTGCSIIFLDGNKSNFDIENLYCADNRVMACLARENWYKKNGELTLTAIKCAELMCKIKESEE